MDIKRSLLALAALGTARAATSVITLDGSGTTNPSKYLWEVIVRIERAPRRARTRRVEP